MRLILSAPDNSELKREFITFARSLYSAENVLFLCKVEQFRQDLLSPVETYQNFLKFGGDYETTASLSVRRHVKDHLREGMYSTLILT